VLSRTVPLTLAAVLVGVLVGCTPTPAPSVEPTPAFSSEAEAFAAAEETYRAYVDALNQVDLSDPATFEEVYAWTTGEANAGARRSFTEMAAEGWSVSGDSRFDHFSPIEYDEEKILSVVTADVCLDVTLVDVLDSNGVSQVPAERVDRQPATLTFARQDTLTGLVIASSEATDAATCD